MIFSSQCLTDIKNAPNEGVTVHSPLHIKIQAIAHRYFNMLMACNYPSQLEDIEDAGAHFRRIRLRQTTKSLIMHDHVLTGRADVDPAAWSLK